MKRRSFLGVALFGLFLFGALATVSGQSWNYGLLDLSGHGKFFDLPFPTELRRAADNTVNMDGFPKVLGLEMVERAKTAVANGYGYSNGTAIYFRFTDKLDLSRLPTGKASEAPDAPLFIMDIDPNSPERGRRFPVQAHFYAGGPKYMSAVRNLLALMPVPGFVLRENNLYAAGVMTNLGAGAAGGRALAAGRELGQIAKGEVPAGAWGQRAFELYKPALESLRGSGVKVEELAALTVFRTGDPTTRMRALFDGVKSLPPLAFETPLHKTREYELYTVLEGAVMMPQFQDGMPPFGHGRGGKIQFDAAGKPVTQRLERVPVAVTVPKGKMPAAGFPILIFIHGTAGVSTQFIDRGQEPDNGRDESQTGLIAELFSHPGAGSPPGSGPALILANRGIAGAGAAQTCNGERGGRPDQLFFYNFLAPETLRDNLLQATAEAAMFLRLLETIQIDPALCPGAAASGPIHFNPELIFGMGQSLGSLILGPWGGVETDVKALIPSGNGAYWTLFIASGNAIGLKSLKRGGKTLDAITGLDLYHPVVTLMGTVLAPADPFVYQPHYFLNPLPGRQPKHVWASFGLYDHYFYPVSQNAAILAMGLDFAGPVREASTGPMLELAGLKTLDYPVTGNIATPAGRVTAVALQYPQVKPLDGHHINYQRDDAKYQYGCFLDSLVKTGMPTLYAPRDQWNAPCGP